MIKLQLSEKHFGNKDYLYWKKRAFKLEMIFLIIMAGETLIGHPSIIIKASILIFLMLVAVEVYYDAKHRIV